MFRFGSIGLESSYFPRQLRESQILLRSGPSIKAFYPAFPDDPNICPVQALLCYESRSKPFRGKQPHLKTGNPLFLSVRKPHKPVKPATISHWLKKIMNSAGIDTNIFSAHSTQGAATSKAKSAGVSTGDILKAANWSTTSTFCRFYHRPVNSGKFGRGVLRTGATSETLVSFKRYHVVN